jgi:F-type H+-transporting ATPase subunit b
MTEVFTCRLRAMDGEAKAGLAEGLTSASDPAIVRSAFDLPAEARADIQRAINETFAADVRLRFETAPNVVSGIELTTNGHAVAWSIAEYLASLEKAIDELMTEPDAPQPEAADPPRKQPTHEQRA